MQYASGGAEHATARKSLDELPSAILVARTHLDIFQELYFRAHIMTRPFARTCFGILCRVLLIIWPDEVVI